MISWGPECTAVFELPNYQTIQLSFRFDSCLLVKFAAAFPISVNLRQRSLTFPHKSIEAAASLKAQVAIKIHCLVIGFSHGKAQAQEVAGAQLLRA